MTTPYGLDTSNPQVQQAFGDALGDLDAANAPFDAALGTPQFIVKNGVRFPIHGGSGDPHGDFNAMWTSWVSGHVLSQPDGGSSFVRVVTWNDGPCPDARTVLTYGESENPANPHFTDQTRLVRPQAVGAGPVLPISDRGVAGPAVTTLTAP